MKRFVCSLLVVLPIAILLVFAQDSPDSPENPEQHLEIRDPMHDNFEDSENATHVRTKRQFGCPANCYSSCTTNQQCQVYQAQLVCVSGCCCPSPSLTSQSLSSSPQAQLEPLF